MAQFFFLFQTGMRILGTVLILLFLLVPVGWFMKIIIYFVALAVHDGQGGPFGAFSRGQLMRFFLDTLGQALRASVQPKAARALDAMVDFTPFPICSASFVQPTPSLTSFMAASRTTFTSSATVVAVTSALPPAIDNWLKSWTASLDASLAVHSMVPGHLLYALLFPLADDRMWHWLLCRLSHLHLGFFLLGSVANVWYTYQILSDMFDFLFMADHDHMLPPAPPLPPQMQPVPPPPPRPAAQLHQTRHPRPEDTHHHANGPPDHAPVAEDLHQHQQQDLQQEHAPYLQPQPQNEPFLRPQPHQHVPFHAAATHHVRRQDVMAWIRTAQHQAIRFAKQLLVTYCCLLVILFWIHFNLLAFVVMTRPVHQPNTPASLSPAAVLDHRQQLTNEFLLELPLWVLRWVTLGVAVTSVMSKAIYPSLSRWTSCIDHEIVLSLPPNQNE
ncbi:hypothetical protein BC940DRAFT_418 [Gongronella butleri]|nr:hypothetical protein BC940DRAFT_418 [Gongronella butleri]